MPERYSIEPVGKVSAIRSHVEDDYWGGERAVITLTDSFAQEALVGVESFSHVEVIFLFHEVDPGNVITSARHPRNNTNLSKIGIFAQCGKNLPNRIGSTICRIESVAGRALVVSELDAIDGTPVLDLKPVMQEFLPRGLVVQPAWSRELMSAYGLSKGSENP